MIRTRLALLVAALAACTSAPAPPEPSRSARALAAAESGYADLRELRDRIEVAKSAGRAVPAALALRHDSLRRRVVAGLAAVDSSALSGEDARALGVMRLTLVRDLAALASGGPQPPAATRPDCGYDPALIATADSLRARMYACYAWVQSRIPLGADTLDRLTLLGELGRTEDARRRRELFLALDPVWRSINADDGRASPYRRLIALEIRARRSGPPPAAEQARAAGLPPDSLEGWLRAILSAWRDAAPDSLIEPWDWYWDTGRASRVLSPRIPRERLEPLTAEVWQALGADVAALRVHYDLAPREGKDPVAFTTFGARAPAIEPWVFATYRERRSRQPQRAAPRDRPCRPPRRHPHPAGVPRLARQRSVHRGGRRLAALDVYEPAWQWRWLGDSVPLADGLRGRYGGIVMDVTWALFEVRMLRDPAADPNQVWTALTRDYLRIRPHPELSWWAMRGQLVDAPGYMMNYAAGAILIAAIRARIRALHGPFVTGDPTWYGWVAPRLYRFGLERTTRRVIEDFLGGPVTPAALLQDMARMRAGMVRRPGGNSL